MEHTFHNIQIRTNIKRKLAGNVQVWLLNRGMIKYTFAAVEGRNFETKEHVGGWAGKSWVESVQNVSVA